MATVSISAAFAQQIVDSAKSIVGCDVNYIDRDGFMIASTNTKRIGQFHEIGYEVIKNAESKEVNVDSAYKGLMKGMNYPIFIDHKVVGVIGITGDPEEVSKYGFLLTKMSEIFIKEYLLELTSMNERQRTNKLLLALLYHDTDGMTELVGNYNIDMKQRYAAIQIVINAQSNQKNLSIIEKNIIQEIEKTGIELFTYIYPNEFVCLVNEKQYQQVRQKMNYYEPSFGSIVNVGVGTLEKFEETYMSYHFAKIGAKKALDQGTFYTMAEDMDLELLLESMEEKIKTQYCEKMVGLLSTEEIELLKVYFQHDLSLKETADELFIHKNTLQYRLNRIHEKTGLDPRSFKNAVPLYLAIRMTCYL